MVDTYRLWRFVRFIKLNEHDLFTYQYSEETVSDLEDVKNTEVAKLLVAIKQDTQPPMARMTIVNRYASSHCKKKKDEIKGTVIDNDDFVVTSKKAQSLLNTAENKGYLKKMDTPLESYCLTESGKKFGQQIEILFAWLDDLTDYILRPKRFIATVLLLAAILNPFVIFDFIKEKVCSFEQLNDVINCE